MPVLVNQPRRDQAPYQRRKIGPADRGGSTLVRSVRWRPPANGENHDAALEQDLLTFGRHPATQDVHYDPLRCFGVQIDAKERSHDSKILRMTLTTSPTLRRHTNWCGNRQQGKYLACRLYRFAAMSHRQRERHGVEKDGDKQMPNARYSPAMFMLRYPQLIFPASDKITIGL